MHRGFSEDSCRETTPQPPGAGANVDCGTAANKRSSSPKGRIRCTSATRDPISGLISWTFDLRALSSLNGLIEEGGLIFPFDQAS